MTTETKNSIMNATVDDDTKKALLLSSSSSSSLSESNPFLSDDLKLSMWIPAELGK